MATEVGSADFESFARALGLGLNQMALYGAKHTVTQDAVNRCFGQIQFACDQSGEVILSWPERDLIINGRLVSQRNALVQSLVSKLRSADIMGLSLKSGLTRAEFVSLLQILSDSTEGQRPVDVGLEEALRLADITHVQVREIKYAAVEDGQIVANVEDLSEGSALESAALNMLGPGRGDNPNDREGARALERAVEDPKRLSDMIMKSARGGPDADNVETLANRILSSLKRGCEVLLDGEAAKTAKGKRALTHNLNRLEAELRHRTPNEIPAECEEGIRSTIGKTVDTLMTESLVYEYTRQRHSLRENEKRLVRFLETKEEGELDLEFLRQKALQMGLSEADIQSLLRQGGLANSADALTRGGEIAALIMQVEGALPHGPGQTLDQERMVGILKEVETQVSVLMEATEVKMRHLEEQLQTAKASIQDKGALSDSGEHAETMRVLAEITQELCQPLSVVNCSIDMVKDERLGPLETSQSDMLALASTSGQRLLTLITKLGEITGMPSTLHPQQDIISDLYK